LIRGVAQQGAEREVEAAIVSDALLSDNDRKEALSLAYLAMIAAKVGYDTVRPGYDRDSIDLLIRAGGGMYPQIGIQAKATSSPIWHDDGLHFQLKRKNYDDLRASRTTPAVLTVLELPANEAEWLDCSVDKLILRRSAWWVSLRDYPAIETESKMVVLAEGQRFDPAALVELRRRAREGDL
jgi:hypothetical protein